MGDNYECGAQYIPLVLAAPFVVGGIAVAVAIAIADLLPGNATDGTEKKT